MEVNTGEFGELQINGPTAAAYYWKNREKTMATFVGAWTRAGDKYSVDQDGYYTFAGRPDDMLKVGGIYVSPIEVEAALMTHTAVLEAAVVGEPDQEELIKLRAYVVTKCGVPATPALAKELRAHVKKRLAPHKCPHWVEFLPALPKTATGKIQRSKLRTKTS
jgi:benzoate-CoA ligase